MVTAVQGRGSAENPTNQSLYPDLGIPAKLWLNHLGTAKSSPVPHADFYMLTIQDRKETLK